MPNMPQTSMLREVIAEHESSVGKFRLLSRCHTTRRVEDDYIVTSKSLGSGYNGHVRLASSRFDVSRDVAVKSFSLRSLSAAKRHEVKMEATVSLIMDHPNIVRVMDVYETHDRLDLVMERMEGGDLFDAVEKNTSFSEHRAAGTVGQILSALAYMHAKSIAHRDLKPENLMYDRVGGEHLKLMDFGFADFARMGRLDKVCGSEDYMAPEVWRGCYTVGCDLWSLGVIAYILLSGGMPFSGSSVELRAKAAKGQYTMNGLEWRSVSSEARAFVQALLEVDPVRRMTALDALAHPWIARAAHPVAVQPSTVAALRAFPTISRFERCSLRMIASTLACGEEETLRAQFNALDSSRRGAISLQELKTELAVGHDTDFRWVEKEGIEDKVSYSDFLAAMIPAQFSVSDNLLRMAFRKFDLEGNGTVTEHDLEMLLGNDCEGGGVEALFREANTSRSGAITFPEFVGVVRGGQRRRQTIAARAQAQFPGPTLLGVPGSFDDTKLGGIKSWEAQHASRADSFVRDFSAPDKDRSCAAGCPLQ